MVSLVPTGTHADSPKIDENPVVHPIRATDLPDSFVRESAFGLWMSAAYRYETFVSDVGRLGSTEERVFWDAHYLDIRTIVGLGRDFAFAAFLPVTLSDERYTGGQRGPLSFRSKERSGVNIVALSMRWSPFAKGYLPSYSLQLRAGAKLAIGRRLERCNTIEEDCSTSDPNVSEGISYLTLGWTAARKLRNLHFILDIDAEIGVARNSLYRDVDLPSPYSISALTSLQYDLWQNGRGESLVAVEFLGGLKFLSAGTRATLLFDANPRVQSSFSSLGVSFESAHLEIRSGLAFEIIASELLSFKASGTFLFYTDHSLNTVVASTHIPQPGLIYSRSHFGFSTTIGLQARF